MKIIVTIIRIIVGVLFIFSGLIKAIDPLGLSYKMQEFFEAWNDGLHKSSFFLSHPLINLFDFLHEHSLTLSIIMIAFEIIAGLALLLAWRMKIFSWLLLLLTLSQLQNNIKVILPILNFSLLVFLIWVL